MARRIEVTLVDDVDGSTGVETVEFSVRGADYEIDLGEANLAKFEKALAPWIKQARKVGGRTRRRRAGGGGRAEVSPTEVRRWAEEQGMEVSSRGRIPREVMAAYIAAH